MQGVWIPGFFACLLHVVIGAILLVNWETDERRFHTPPQLDHVAAKLVVLPEDVVAPKPAEAAAPEPVASKPPEDEFESARAEPVAIPKQNTPEYAIKKPDKPKPKPKKKPEKVKQPKADPQALARMRERAAEIRRQQQARDNMSQAVQQEQSSVDQQVSAEVTQSYIAMIQRVIQNNWKRPLSARAGMQTMLMIQLIPSGDIVGVTILRSSGDSAFDRSAENAVKKAGRFPELRNLPSDVFERQFRRLTFRFSPEDLRT